MPKHTLPDGFTLHYLIEGQHHPPHHAPVILLHGLGSAAEDWALQIPVFAEHYRTLAIDAPGHGQSDKPVQRYEIPKMAAQISALLTDLNCPPAHLVGLSMGGVLALQMAVAHPQQVRSLVLANSFAKLRSRNIVTFWRSVQRVARVRFSPMQSVGQMIARTLFPHPEQALLYHQAAERIASNPREVYWQNMLALARINLEPDLPSVQVPTLIVAGENDLTVPLYVKQILHRCIPNSQLAMIENSGHGSPIDQPEAFNNLVLPFIQQHTPTPTPSPTSAG